MLILGVSCYYHDSSAALIKDGEVVAAASEERFSRKKHDKSFPYGAIEYCLSSQGITAEDLDYVAFYEKPLLKFERVLFQHIHHFPRSLKTFLGSMPSWFNKKLRVLRTIRKDVGFNGGVVFIPHHVSHAASAFYPSPFEEAAILTVDGVGEWATTAYGKGSENTVELFRELHFPHSVGLLYSTITAYLGFRVNNSEYKVMGLASYGDNDRKTNPYYRKLAQVIDIKKDGSFRLDMRYFVFDHKDRMPSKELCDLLGGPVAQLDSPVTKRKKDIAAALQMLSEDILIRILNHVYEEVQSDNLVLAGGVALNSVFNGKILSNTPFKDIWIQPNASDGGTSLGAALYLYHHILEHTSRREMRHAYLGPTYENTDVKRFLEERNIVYHEYNDESLIDAVSDILLDDQVVGWFQGGLEWGPRALGARSILANPANPDAQKLLNEKVKHRESFRPFAPSVIAEEAPNFFECDEPTPIPADFMLMVYPIREEYHDTIPSVVHIDGSGRLQTIHRSQHPRYYDLIKVFGEKSGFPILVNTSFNIRGEPIVCTPGDAYRCMMGTKIDCLVIGNTIIWRDENLRDAWDSSKHVHE